MEVHLPIGYKQLMSVPSVVSSMLNATRNVNELIWTCKWSIMPSYGFGFGKIDSSDTVSVS